MNFRGVVYRALNPIWAADPISGQGAATYGGRFNPKGTTALYAALRPETAIREANQVGTLQPTLLVAIEVDARPVFDARDQQLLSDVGLTPEKIADPNWRNAMLEGSYCGGHDLYRQLVSRGFSGALVPCFANGAQANETNLVLWLGNGDISLRVVDDDDRLAKPPAL